MSTNDNDPRLAPEPLSDDADKLQAHHSSSIAGRIRNRFLTGLIVAGPVAITAYLTWSFIKWVDGLITPFIPVAYRPETYLPIPIPGLGLIIVFVGLTLLGFLTANLVGRTLVELGEIVLGRMPIIRPIYKALKQVFATVFSSTGSAFRRVGLVEFPAPGMWSLVFLSAPAGADVASRLPGAGEYISVFLPCTPNPTTGFFFYVQRSDVIELDITSEAAATLIVSAGMIQPNGEQQTKLSAFAEAARVARNARNGRPVVTAK
jgi:uncharacterized membrane protein